MLLQSYEQSNTPAFQEQYFCQRANDLLEQIERLKAIDTSEEPELQIQVSQTIQELYKTLKELFL